MKLSTLIAGLVAVVAVGFVIWSFQAFSGRDASASGATVYSAAAEVQLKGVVRDVREFVCPESEHEMGAHLMLQTDTGVMEVHLLPSHLMRSRNVSFAPGDRITVVGSEVRVFDRHDVIAREILRDDEKIVLRDQQGNTVYR